MFCNSDDGKGFWTIYNLNIREAVTSMVKREIMITNLSGLESKPAAMFIQKASNFKSSIWVEKGERKANAKSLLGLLSLSVGNGNKIILITEGEDEIEAAEELEKYLVAGLGENV
jgi:phosphotransferase system HPr (HPr) family protein